MAKVTKSEARDSATPPTETRPKAASSRLTAHVELGRFGKSPDGELFVEVKFKHRGKTRGRLLPLAGLTPSSAIFDSLTADGARLISGPARHEFIGRVQAHQSKKKILLVATRLGFLDGNFVLPKSKYGPKKTTLRAYLDRSRPERFSRYRVGGSLRGWQELAKLAVGNTRLEFLIGVTFSGPVAALLGVEQAGLMPVGPPETGKSTALMVAGSVWGCHFDPNMAARLGFAQPFNATDNDLEDESLAANHTLLAVDETRAAGFGESEIGRMLVRLVMRWEAGFEKGRKNATKTRQAAAVPFILTSNLSLGQLAAAAGMRIDDALHGRLISVPPPASAHGLFESLHGEKDVVAFSRRLRSLALTHFGYPSRKFLQVLIDGNDADPERLRAWLEQKRAYYLKHADKINAPGRKMNRIHEKMATVYAAGRFAIKQKILPWKFNALRDALLACTRDHVALVANEASLAVAQGHPHSAAKPAIDTAQLLEQLRDDMRANREAIVDTSSGGAMVHLGEDTSR